MKNILFITYDFPYPPTSGGKSRAFNLIKYSLDKGTRLTLLSFVREDYDSSWNKKIMDLGVNEIYVVKRKKIKSLLTFSENLISADSIFKTLYFDDNFYKKLIEIVKKNKINLVHFESSYTGYYIGDKLSELGVRQILGTENIEYMLYEDYLRQSSNIFKKTVLSYQVNRFKNEEEKMMKKVDISLAVTQEEADYIRKLSGKKCEVIENGVSVDSLQFKFSDKKNNNLLFVGNFTYIPNIKAAEYFIKHVLLKFDKNVKLTIIGKNADKFFKPSEQIILKNYVEDLISEYRNADCLIFPIKIGGGTNFKILEAMALGTPVLGFPDKIENTGAIAGKHFYKASSALEFVKGYENIISDKTKAKMITQNARKLIEEKYSWVKIGQKLNKVWEDLINEK